MQDVVGVSGWKGGARKRVEKKRGGEERRWEGGVIRGGVCLRGGALLEKLVSLTISFRFLTVKLVLMTIIAI